MTNPGKLGLCIMLVIAVGIVLSVTQIITGDWSNPILSAGPSLSIAGAIAGAFYSLWLSRKNQETQS